LAKKWFHGNLTSDEANSLLSQSKNGDYLVRTSTTHPKQPFVITKVTKDNKTKKRTVPHYRIDKVPSSSRSSENSTKLNSNDEIDQSTITIE